MATKFYFHAATDGTTGLPSAEQHSTITSDKDAEGSQTTNRQMDTTIGAGQTSIVLTSLATTATSDYYFTRFVSPPLYQPSIAANTWTYNFAASGSTTSANFPVSASNKSVPINCYVWRPSNTSKVGTILEGNSDATVDEAAAATEAAHHVAFSGSAVSNMQNGDVIIFEVWFTTTQGNATARTDTFFYDGTTENTTELATVSDHASFLETPENLVLSNFVLQTSIHKYDLAQNIAQESIHKYNIAQDISAASIHKYDIVNDVLQTSVHKYDIEVLNLVLQTSVHKYDITGNVLQTNTHKYDLLQNIAQTSIHKYDLLNTVEATSSVHKYDLLQNVQQTSAHKYDLLQSVLQTSVHKYDLFAYITQTTAHKYDLFQDIVAVSVHKYDIESLTSVMQTTIHKYDIGQYIVSASTQKYDVLNNLLQTSTHKYDLLQNVAQTSTHKYDLLTSVMEVTATSIHKYDMLNTVPVSSSIHSYDLLQFILAETRHKYKILLPVVPTPLLPSIDFGATPARTNKGITLRCFSPEINVDGQGMTDTVDKFNERLIIEVAMRDARAEGVRLGREPAPLVAMEKYLVELIKVNRTALHDQGVQYMDVVSAETFPTLEGGEEMQQIWYKLHLTIRLHYWMRVTEPM